jgi:hypothetical protein
MKKTFLLVASLMALQTVAYADCGKKCTKLGCRNGATFDWCQENCSDNSNFKSCQASHDRVDAAKAEKEEKLAQIEEQYQQNVAAAAELEAAE